MGQSCQELVLAAVGVAQLPNEAQAFVGHGDVVTDGSQDLEFVFDKLVPAFG